MSNKDNQTTFLSSKFEKFIGLKNNNYKNETWRNKIHPRERDLVNDTHIQAFKSKLKFEISYRIKNNDNNYRWILETGIPYFNDDNNFIGFITASIYFTDRKNAEEALKSEETLRKSNELFRNTLESISLAAISLDRKGNITFCNNHFSSIVKINKNNLLNKNWFELFSPKYKIK